MSTQPRFQQTFTDFGGDGKAERVETLIYDENGRLAIETADFRSSQRDDSSGLLFFRANGLADSITTYTYDSNGNPSSKAIDYRSGVGIRDYTLFSDYSSDEAGNLTITYTDGPGNAYSLGDYVYSFNTNGDPISALEPNDSKEYTYNEAGQIVLFEQKRAFSSGLTTKAYTYNEAGQLTNIISTPAGGEATIETNTYDEAGNIATFEITYPNGFTQTTTNTYDESGQQLLSAVRLSRSPNRSDGSSPFVRARKTITDYTYNDSGNLIKETVEQQEQKTADDDFVFYDRDVTEYTYDEAGNITLKSLDYNGDGKGDFVEVFAYDADGNIVYESSDNGTDNDRIDRVTTRIFSDEVPGPVAADDAIATANDILVIGSIFSDNGNGRDTDPKGTVLRISQINGASTINEQITLASGALLRVADDGAFVYDPNGAFEALLPGATATDEFTYTTVDIFGSTDTATATFTIEGATTTNEPTDLPRQEVFNDSNGIPNVTRTRTFDIDGNLIREVNDRITTRSSDLTEMSEFSRSINTYTYDAAGNQTSETRDNNGDGIADSINTYTYDAASNQTSQAYDRDADGIAESTFAYTYDAEGSRQFDYVLRSDFRYDDMGNLIISYRADNDDDGRADNILTYRFDTAGQLAETTEDYGADGEIDVRELFSYDAMGNATVSQFSDADMLSMASGISDATAFPDENLLDNSDSFMAIGLGPSAI